MSDDSETDVEEHRVSLGRYDMDHLAAGQPVFMGVGGDLVILRFDDYDEWNRVPVSELEDLAGEWEKTGADDYDHGDTHHDIFTGKQRLKCSQELRALIEDYNE